MIIFGHVHTILTLYSQNEPRHEKTGFLVYAKNKNTDQLRGSREADQRLCFRYIASTVSLLF